MLIHNAEVTGSLNINNVPFNSGSFSGSFQGDGSQLSGVTGATTASYVEYSNVGNKPALVSGSEQISFNGIVDKPTLVSGSAQITYSELSNIPVGIVSGSTQISFNGITDKPALVSSSAQITYSGLSGIPSGIVSGSSQVSFNGIVDKPTLVSGSSQVTYGGLSGIPTGIVSGSSQVSFNGIVDKPTLVSGSAQISYPDLSNIPNGIVSSSTQITGYNIFATTGSNTFNGAQTITGSIFGSGNLTIDGCITATGQIVAQTINVQQVTSSIVYSCGSNIFGTDISNTQQFTGSMFATGSLRLTGPMVGSSTACFGGNVTTSGCVGIGTPTAATPLHIVTAGLPTIRLTLGSEARCHNINGVNLGRDLQVLPFRHFSVQTGNGIAEGQIVLNAYEDFIVGTGASYTSRLTITPTGIACFACQVCAPVAIFSGCVGIGATSPSARLQVNTSSAGANALQLGVTSQEQYVFETGISGVTNGALVIKDSVTPFTYLTLRGGNVGIGTTCPTRALTVSGKAQLTSTSNTNELYLADACTSIIDNQWIGSIGNNITIGAGGFHRMNISSTGIACFACQVCAPAAIFSGNVTISGGNDLVFRDASNYISSPATDTLRIVTANSERVRITSTGIACFACQVCIPSTAVISGGGNTLILRKGTGTPAIAFAGTSDEATFLVESMSGGGMKWYTSPAGCTLSNAPWNAKFNMDVNGISTFSCQVCAPVAIFSGCVGIGSTTSPTNKLTVLGCQTGTQINTIPVAKFVNTGNEFSKVVIGSDNTNYDGVISMDNNATLANTKLRVYIGNGTGSTAGHSNDQIVLQGNGNVGIGTCNPNAKLTVWTPSTTGLQTALRLNNPFGFDNQNTGAQIIFSQDRSVAEDLKQGIIAVGQQDSGTSATSYMAFYTNNTGLGERLRISSTGIACFQNTVCAPVFIATNSITAQGFNTSIGTVSAATSTWVTIYTISSIQATEGVYNVYAHYNDDGGGMAFTQVLADRTHLREANKSDGTAVSIQLSGRNIQVQQIYGTTVDIQFSILWQKLR
jgi:hypothetical protein